MEKGRGAHLASRWVTWRMSDGRYCGPVSCILLSCAGSAFLPDVGSREAVVPVALAVESPGSRRRMEVRNHNTP